MHTCGRLKPGPGGIPSRFSSAGGRSILCTQFVQGLDHPSRLVHRITGSQTVGGRHDQCQAAQP